MKTIQGLKYTWQLPQIALESIAHHAAALHVSYPVIEIAMGRGYLDRDSLARFLFLPKEELIGDPILLKDAQKAVDRIIQAINTGEKILIAGDYDVDGITSSALMMYCLVPLGAQINFFLPHRVHDGYGLSVKTIERAAQSGYKVVITVDNGITAYEPAREALKHGIDLIITDHHKPHPELPQAYAIVNPHQDDCTYPFKKFAGVGVGFKLMQLLYSKLGMPLPEKVYELLLLGTVADVVPLVEENRYWVRYGLQHLNKNMSKPVDVLRSNAGVTKSNLSATDIGFFITPQINALGRLEDPREGVKFLIGHDEQETERIGRVLGQLNQARKQIERSIIDDVTKVIEAGEIDIQTDKVIIAAQSGWQAGVIGLVAGRIASNYCRPTILLHTTASGIAKGSCRSIPALNMFEALQSVKDLLITFGGHAQAAGLSIKTEHIPELKKRLNEYISERLGPEDFKPKLVIDAQITMHEVTRKLVDECAYLEPFGNENPKPVFKLSRALLVEKPQLLKEAHVKAKIAADGGIKPIIFFNRPELYELFVQRYHDSFEVAVTIVENEWQGQVTIELQGHDIAFTESVL